MQDYASYLFTDEQMKKYLSKETYNKFIKIKEEGEDIDKDMADALADAMKKWAISKGATHFTHWFQPLTGVTAEKHEAFIHPSLTKDSYTLKFSGKELMKGESDASSFPSGGLRATFEARGYTGWDCTSPVFIKEEGPLKILCIPTIFFSYSGEALDKKTPLIRSIAAINKEALRLLRIFGDNETKRVICEVGPEQEYFLIDREMYKKRMDLLLCGRTLFGAKPPKGQELEDHYYGALKLRVTEYMKDLNETLWKLGVNAKIQHNEVAPCQHELAPVYCDANTANDHNQLTMEYMRKIAKKHNLKCLLHEKPFKGINGSGKHNNWSLCTDTGRNLFEPGKTPNENAQFLVFLAAVMKAVDDNPILLRYASSNSGNDLRLGGNEAPPGIISIYIGSQLSDIVEQIVKDGQAKTLKVTSDLDLALPGLPSIIRDNTDRNRTSPIAFTGNKFEFRMVGSSLSIATINTVINTIVADVLRDFADRLESVSDEEKNTEINSIIRETFIRHKKIIFDGDGYSSSWLKESESRGLPNCKSYVESIAALTDEKTIGLFSKHKVLSSHELRSRAEVSYTNYSSCMLVEARTMIEMTRKLYIPAGLKYKERLLNILKTSKDVGINQGIEKNILDKVNIYLNNMLNIIDNVDDSLDKGKNLVGKEQAFYFNKKIIIELDKLRTYVDNLETITDKELWPVPSYYDLLYSM